MFVFIFLILVPLASSAVFFKIKNLNVQFSASIVVATIHLILSLSIYVGAIEPDFPLFFSIDPLSKLFLVVLSNVYFWVTLVSYQFIKRSFQGKANDSKKFYFALLNFYLTANTAAILSNHFGMYWVAAEATTLSVAPLIYFYRSEESLEAMWKYLFLVSIGIAFAFIGILFLSLSAKGTPLEGSQLFFADFIKNAVLLQPVWLKASFIFLFVGLSTKIGIAPMHYGDIDATSNSPSPIAALMSGSLRITALLGVLRIYQIISPTTSFEFARNILIIGSMLSIFAAFIYMFKISNYKRMIAYSSVEHLGIITLGIATGGMASVGAFYHVIYNSMVKIVLFLAAGTIHNKYGSRDVEKVRSVLNLLPKAGWLFVLGYFAISGIPPFGIFFSELKIFDGLLYSENPWLLAILMFFLLFIFINMGKTILTMLFKQPENEKIEETKEKWEINHFVAIILLITLSLISISSPEVLQNNINEIAKSIGAGL